MFDIVPFRRNHKLSRGYDAFENFVNEFFNDDFFYPTDKFIGFSADLSEDKDNYLIDADLPGMNKDNINIDLNDNNLTISAKREDVTEEKNKENYVRRERYFGEFRRSFYIDNVDEKNIKASFKDGVLHVVLPKKDKTISGRKIDIE